MGSRYFPNPYTDLKTSGQIVDASGKLLAMTVTDRICKTYRKLLASLENKLLELSNSSDASIYTGTSGLAYLYLHIFEKEGTPEFLQKANSLAEKGVGKLRRRDLTFLCGDVGRLCVAAAAKEKMGDANAARHYFASILEYLPAVVDLGNDMPNELLYGRVGYLYALLYLNKYVAPVDAAIFRQVTEAIVSSGRQRQGSIPPLMWAWHGKEYLGAAHGVAGILYLLLQVKEHLIEANLELVRQTIDFLLSTRFKSGNLPSSIGNNDDRLVHWCHGAPGFVQLLLEAAHVFKEKRYLDAAVVCGRVVWQRGLLKKGYGICHGVAGNAYTFIALFQATGELCHLQRALHLANWCDSYPENQESPPDRPYSLFEGLAGIIFFLKDVQDPLDARFPAYSINTFHKLTF